MRALSGNGPTKPQQLFNAVLLPVAPNARSSWVEGTRAEASPLALLFIVRRSARGSYREFGDLNRCKALKGFQRSRYCCSPIAYAMHRATKRDELPGLEQWLGELGTSTSATRIGSWAWPKNLEVLSFAGSAAPPAAKSEPVERRTCLLPTTPKRWATFDEVNLFRVRDLVEFTDICRCDQKKPAREATQDDIDRLLM